MGSTKLVVVSPILVIHTHTLIPISRGIFPPLLPPAGLIHLVSSPILSLTSKAIIMYLTIVGCY